MSSLPSAPPASRPVLIMNPRSGGGKVEKFHLEDECRARGIEPVVLSPGDDLLAAGRGRHRARRRRDRHGRRRRLPGARGLGGEQARCPARGDPRRHAEPLRARPRPRPRRRRRGAGRLHRRRRAADRPGVGQRPRVREQRLARPVRQDRAVARIPRREGADRARHAARPARAGRRAARSAVRRPRRGATGQRAHAAGLERSVRARWWERSRDTGAPGRGHARGREPAGEERRRGTADRGPRRRRQDQPVLRVARVERGAVPGRLRSVGGGGRRRRGPDDDPAAWCSNRGRAPCGFGSRGTRSGPRPRRGRPRPWRSRTSSRSLWAGRPDDPTISGRSPARRSPSS